MRLFFCSLLLHIIPFSSCLAQTLPLPKYDRVDTAFEDKKPSTIKYYLDNEIVLWKAYRPGSMMYLPGQDIFTNDDSAYLYYSPAGHILYKFGGEGYTMEKFSATSSIVYYKKYEEKKLQIEGRELMERDPSYAPQFLNMPRSYYGKWNYYDKQGKINKTVDFNTGRVSTINKNFVRNQQRFIKKADSTLKAAFGDLFNNHIRLNLGKSFFSFAPGFYDSGLGDRLPDSIFNSKDILYCSLSYDFIINDSIRSHEIKIDFDEKGNIKMDNWNRNRLYMSGLPSTRLLTELMDYKKLLELAKKHGMKNDHRLYPRVEWIPDQNRIRGNYFLVFYYDKSNDPILGADRIIYKRLSLNLHNGKEDFNENYRFEFFTTAEPAPQQ